MRRVLLLTIALWVPALAGYADESIEVDGRTVDVHVLNLRRKIEPDPNQPQYIRTIYGLGYKLGK